MRDKQLIEALFFTLKIQQPLPIWLKISVVALQIQQH